MWAEMNYEKLAKYSLEIILPTPYYRISRIVESVLFEPSLIVPAISSVHIYRENKNIWCHTGRFHSNLFSFSKTDMSKMYTLNVKIHISNLFRMMTILQG